ncbi:MAG: hypothetical protein HOH04_09635 [Rhodospirillaceae bacterium]|nr:hypothetical protein [Rhodospirillaceae bacterium]
MSKLTRLKPSPIPAIHPVAEYAVEGEAARWYAEMKSALQVPWMGVVTMAFAHYPHFFAALWQGTSPIVSSQAFVAAAQSLQGSVEKGVTNLHPPVIADRLAATGYGAREIEQIRAANDVFSHGNHHYALIATIARTLLEGRDLTNTDDAVPFVGRHAPEVSVPFVLMEAHHADAPTRAVYEDIKEVLGLPFVNTDYRAFARWPSYWTLAWNDLRQVAGGDEHEALCQSYHDAMAEIVTTTLPNPARLTSKMLRDAAEADGGLAEITDVVRLFQWLLPGLAVNVAYLRHQLRST